MQKRGANIQNTTKNTSNPLFSSNNELSQKQDIAQDNNVPTGFNCESTKQVIKKAKSSFSDKPSSVKPESCLANPISKDHHAGVKRHIGNGSVNSHSSTVKADKGFLSLHSVGPKSPRIKLYTSIQNTTERFDNLLASPRRAALKQEKESLPKATVTFASGKNSKKDSPKEELLDRAIKRQRDNAVNSEASAKPLLKKEKPIGPPNIQELKEKDDYGPKKEQIVLLSQDEPLPDLISPEMELQNKGPIYWNSTSPIKHTSNRGRKSNKHSLKSTQGNTGNLHRKGSNALKVSGSSVGESFAKGEQQPTDPSFPRCTSNPFPTKLSDNTDTIKNTSNKVNCDLPRLNRATSQPSSSIFDQGGTGKVPEYSKQRLGFDRDAFFKHSISGYPHALSTTPSDPMPKAPEPIKQEAPEEKCQISTVSSTAKPKVDLCRFLKSRNQDLGTSLLPASPSLLDTYIQRSQKHALYSSSRADPLSTKRQSAASFTPMSSSRSIISINEAQTNAKVQSSSNKSNQASEFVEQEFSPENSQNENTSVKLESIQPTSLPCRKILTNCVKKNSNNIKQAVSLDNPKACLTNSPFKSAPIKKEPIDQFAAFESLNYLDEGKNNDNKNPEIDCPILNKDLNKPIFAKSSTPEIKKEGNAEQLLISEEKKSDITVAKDKLTSKTSRPSQSESSKASNMEIDQIAKQAASPYLPPTRLIKPAFGCQNEDSYIDYSDDFDEELDEILSSNYKETNPEPHLWYIRCQVLEVITSRYHDFSRNAQVPEKTLMIYDSIACLERKVFLRGPWLECEIETGTHINIVSPKVVFGKTLITYIIDEEIGYLITYPEELLTSTYMASAMNCERKAVLSNQLTNVTTHPAPIEMTLGCLIHDVFQTSLMNDNFSKEFMDKTLTNVLPHYAESMYQCDLTVDEILTKVGEEAGHQLRSWASRYLGQQARDDATFYCTNSRWTQPIDRVTISGAFAVEESMQSVMFGFKGKIDATVQTVGLLGNSPRVTLLEVKTGKVSHSLAHRAQATIYSLMMEEKYRTPITGVWIFYTQGEVGKDMMTLIPMIREDRMRLVIHRNQLARALANPKSAPLPSLSKDTRICGYCELNSGCALYNRISTYNQNKDNILDYKADHDKLFPHLKPTNHLTPHQLQFFNHWSSLLAMEEGKTHRFLAQAWVLSSQEKMKLGTCIGQLKVSEVYSKNKLSHPASSQPKQDEFAIENLGFAHGRVIYKLVPYNCEQEPSLDKPSLAQRVGNYQQQQPATSYSKFDLRRTNLQAFDPIIVSTDLSPTSDSTLYPSSPPTSFGLAEGILLELNEDYLLVEVNQPLRGCPRPADKFHHQFNQKYEVTRELHNPLINITKVNTVNMVKKNDNTLYRIDHDIMGNKLKKVRTNLVDFMMKPELSKIRALIVDLIAPEFSSIQLSTANSLTKNITIESDESGLNIQTVDNQIDKLKLNCDQTNALKTAIRAKDYCLVLGMPGTGKTTTIAHLIKLLVGLNYSVLVASHTHSAVDTILNKVLTLYGGNEDKKSLILRLGNRIDRIHHNILPYTVAGHLRNIGENNELHKVSRLAQLYDITPIVATTCLSTHHHLFAKRKFDYCIVDEASQVTLPIILNPITKAKKFILVGDHYQLPPLVSNVIAREKGLATSLFKRLSKQHPHAVAHLRHQYRMNQDIMSLANHLIYNQALRCGSHEVSKRRIKLDESALLDLHKYIQPTHHCPGIQSGTINYSGAGCWLQDAINPDHTVLFLDTDRLPAPHATCHESSFNPIEQLLTTQLIHAFIQLGLPPDQICVLSPFRLHINQMRSSLAKRDAFRSVELLTVDQAQGQDKECVILNLVKSNCLKVNKKILGAHMLDWRRINVSLTRAKGKLIILGSGSTLDQLAAGCVWQELISLCKRKGWYRLLPKEAHNHHNPTIIKDLSQIILQSQNKTESLPSDFIYNTASTTNTIQSMIPQLQSNINASELLCEGNGRQADSRILCPNIYSMINE